MKLKESIPSNSVKIIDIFSKIDAGILDTSPDFQRKLIWKKQHKYAFIETILMNFPFPEVYIASAEMDVETLKSREIVVDGKQRLTTIVDYIKGINDFVNQKKITPFETLSTEEKRDFLNYLVTVKDLKDMKENYIKEIFQRINSTEYSLNANERINALYGGGEFALFCKQIVDFSYTATLDDTDIIIDSLTKQFLNSFFIDNEIFSENDKARMFDEHYIMLIISTFLEGDYYGRSSKVNEYLEKYNSSFEMHEQQLKLLLNSITIISKLGFYKNSYWFNKANLFTLIIELSKFKESDINLQKLEEELLNLETKVDLYFSDDDTSEITENEKKYFEVSRQGSHEKANRIFRGKLINDLVKKCLDKESIEESYPIILLTQTGLNKMIMDATKNVREFFKINQIHDYESQLFGPEHKIILKGKFKLLEREIETDISLYRSNGRGDYRIWFSGLGDFANANDKLALIVSNGVVNIYNTTKYPNLHSSES